MYPEPVAEQYGVSIHAPRVGGDVYSLETTYNRKEFQSTPPAWGATQFKSVWNQASRVSIHAPRVGGDCGFSA